MRALPVQVAHVTMHVVLKEWHQNKVIEVDLMVVHASAKAK